jgi:radical SAM superfamily enzyme YgiQ (UPF0313 family)
VAAAAEAAGAEVRIFDYIVCPYSPAILASHLAEFRPDVVGISSVTLNYYRALAIITEVKKFDSRIITLFGGPHVSFTATETLAECPAVDIVVIGEGEATCAELLPLIHQQDKWGEVAGIAFRSSGEIILTSPRPLIQDLDSLPLPARHLLPLSRYQALGFPISIITSRGCPYNCIFCVGRRMVGGKVRYRSVASIVDEIEDILSYGLDRINFADDLFVSRKSRVLAVCAEIEKRNLRFAWSAFARVNTVDADILRAMKSAGCDAVSFGVESGNQAILDRIGKGITPEMVRRAVNLCREAGILAHTSFMVGLPGETKETLAETEAFARSIGSLYGYHFLAPFPGTVIRQKSGELGLKILTDDWSRYDANSAIVATEELSDADMDEFVGAFEAEIEKTWQEMVAGFRLTNSPEIDLQVRGQFRTRLVYRLLSENILEEFSYPVGKKEAPDLALGLAALSRHVQARTEAETDLVEETLINLTQRGFLVPQPVGELLTFIWTHNRHRTTF